MTETIKAHIEQVKAFQTDNKEQLEAFRIKYLGSKGLLKDFFAEFKNVPNEQKKEFADVFFIERGKFTVPKEPIVLKSFKGGK